MHIQRPEKKNEEGYLNRPKHRLRNIDNKPSDGKDEKELSLNNDLSQNNHERASGKAERGFANASLHDRDDGQGKGLSEL